MSIPRRGPHVQLVDSCIIGNNTPAPEPEEPRSSPAPGALLPPGFPKEGYTADQLLELEEWYLVASQTALQRFFFLTRTTRDGGEPTARSVMYCCAILAKIFGFNPGMSWAAIARQLGTGASHLCHLRRRVWSRLREGMKPATAFELLQNAARLRATARKMELAAHLRRRGKTMDEFRHTK